MIEEKFVCYDDYKLSAFAFEVEKPKAVVQLIYGLKEDYKNYFYFAKFLNSKKFNVYISTQRGNNIFNKKNSEKLIDEDLFSKNVCDQLCVTNMLKDRYKKPIFVIGHSYGSFLLQAYIKKNKYAEKVIMLGSTYMNNPKIYLAKLLSYFAVKIKGYNHSAKYFEEKIYSSFNRKFDSGNWITSDDTWSKDKKQKEQYLKLGFYYSLFKHMPKLYSKLSTVNKDLPILILSGTDDPVGSFGNGTIKLLKTYKKHKLNAKLILYPNARHNLIWEKNKKEVFNDIYNFLAIK